LSELHPAHALYAYAQNQMSVLSEQLTMLDEMARFVRLLGPAEDDYMPGGPPASPITTSFFTMWAFFDACVGINKETIATVAMAVGKAHGMSEELLAVFKVMQDSRMGIYRHEGFGQDLVVLKELVSGQVSHAYSTSGYLGEPGELWYVRLLPPPVADTPHIVITTPYVLEQPDEAAWMAYFERTLADSKDLISAHAQHMKYGPHRRFWCDFVFEAYSHHQFDAIFLHGLPDMPESCPFSRVNF